MLRYSALERDFRHLQIKTGCGTHSPACSRGTGASFRGLERRGRKAHTHFHLMLRVRIECSSVLAPPWTSMAFKRKLPSLSTNVIN